ncbi:MAG: rRNA maturation RNase YbeY [Caulobacteraceae bacterium]|nr:rRNA maturation RNase YbeY [Caulobacteraceae bacterium]
MIDIEIEDDAWLAALPEAADRVRAAADAALAFAGRSGSAVVLLADDDAVRELNGQFRRKDSPTNVLSFPAPPNPEGLLGDVALAFGVCAAEAKAQGKPLADHLQHLVAHGVLHLVGYDHQDEAEAEAMEALERRILDSLGVADPYAERD